MVKYATRFDTENGYSIPNPGPTPKIDGEEGLPPGKLDIAWVDSSRKDNYHWTKGLKWYERLHAHATLNSARKHYKCKRPYAPRDELDFVLDAVYTPLKDPFSEKQDVYLQPETALGSDMNIGIKERSQNKKNQDECGRCLPEEKETWRVLKNRIVIFPDKSLPRNHPINIADYDQRRENIYHVKLNIAADHTPQTNPGYSRTPSGGFYAI